MRFHRKARLAQDARLPSIQSRFIWLTCFPSARRTWASVYDCAIRGHLGLTPPSAMVDASFAGHRTSDTVYATRMTVRRLVPSEQALPFAERYAPGSFVFFEYSSTAAKKINDFRAVGNAHPCIKTQLDIVKGPTGWRMTDKEWNDVLVELERAGFSSDKPAKANVDIALEKFGEGKAWPSMGSAWRSAEYVYQRWSKQGKWDLLKQVLSDLRSCVQ